MSCAVDREGTFQATILEYGLKEFSSGTVAVSIRVALTAWWDGEGWVPWSEYDMEAIGSMFVVKKNGEMNNSQIESLVRAAGWDGSFTSVVQGTWQPTPCQVVVKQEVYNNVTSYRIAFVNEFDRVPGGLSNVDETKARELEARFGSKLRAVSGNVKRNAAPAAKKEMPAPARPNGAWKPPAAAPAEKAAETEDIPF